MQLGGHQGESGVPFSISANAPGTPSQDLVYLTGTGVGDTGSPATVTLELIVPSTGYGVAPTRSSLAMTVDAGGLTCSRTTLAGDFPVAGDYAMQLKVVYSSGKVWRSDMDILTVRTSIN